MFVYSGLVNKCFQLIMDAVMKYRWVGSWQDGKVMQENSSAAGDGGWST